jgi:hypothetical protein
MSLFVYSEFRAEDLMGSDCRQWAAQDIAKRDSGNVLVSPIRYSWRNGVIDGRR